MRPKFGKRSERPTNADTRWVVGMEPAAAELAHSP